MLAGRITLSFSYNLPVFLVGTFITMVAQVIMYASNFTLSKLATLQIYITMYSKRRRENSGPKVWILK